MAKFILFFSSLIILFSCSNNFNELSYYKITVFKNSTNYLEISNSSDNNILIIYGALLDIPSDSITFSDKNYNVFIMDPSGIPLDSVKSIVNGKVANSNTITVIDDTLKSFLFGKLELIFKRKTFSSKAFCIVKERYTTAIIFPYEQRNILDSTAIEETNELECDLLIMPASQPLSTLFMGYSYAEKIVLTGNTINDTLAEFSVLSLKSELLFNRNGNVEISTNGFYWSLNEVEPDCPISIFSIMW